ncbi:hypothetical protein TEA_027460 [Camellia sinensis var. sinensis]|uniref:Peptidase A1 domain-containing protein n=1 Tax=Camellia sinensis var. sinensis TaxID=542762 RepID=A0A4S4DRJ4_CAMSN|nr:hypothetical protein TEA_027460 [Camellia sinensis var. sinensis]
MIKLEEVCTRKRLLREEMCSLAVLSLKTIQCSAKVIDTYGFLVPVKFVEFEFEKTPICIAFVLMKSWAHYNVILKSIEVGDSVLQLPSDGFDTDSGKLMIMDSGTTLAYLGDELFNPLMKKPAQPAPVPSTGPNANPLDLFPQGLPNMGSNAAGAGTLDFLRNSQQGHRHDFFSLEQPRFKREREDA